MWRLETADGSWAVKVSFQSTSEDEVRAATAFQEAARAAGVPTPRVVRTTEACVFADVDGGPVRVYEWVDLLAPEPRLDPAPVGAVVAPSTAWAPDGRAARPVVSRAGRRRALGPAGRAAARRRGTVRGRLADLRDELVALESWIEPPRGSGPVTATSGPTTCCPPRTAECASSTGRTAARLTPARSSRASCSSSPAPTPGRARALTTPTGGRRARGSEPARGLLDAHRPARAHHRDRRHRLADAQSPLPRRSDAAAWIGEVLDEPHTRELLDRLLAL